MKGINYGRFFQSKQVIGLLVEPRNIGKKQVQHIHTSKKKDIKNELLWNTIIFNNIVHDKNIQVPIQHCHDPSKKSGLYPSILFQNISSNSRNWISNQASAHQKPQPKHKPIFEKKVAEKNNAVCNSFYYQTKERNCIKNENVLINKSGFGKNEQYPYRMTEENHLNSMYSFINEKKNNMKHDGLKKNKANTAKSNEHLGVIGKDSLRKKLDYNNRKAHLRKMDVITCRKKNESCMKNVDIVKARENTNKNIKSYVNQSDSSIDYVEAKEPTQSKVYPFWKSANSTKIKEDSNKMNILINRNLKKRVITSNQRKEEPSKNKVDVCIWSINFSEKKEHPIKEIEIPQIIANPTKKGTKEFPSYHKIPDSSGKIMAKNTFSNIAWDKNEEDPSIKKVEPWVKKINFCRMKQDEVFFKMRDYLKKKLNENVFESFEPTSKLLNSKRCSVAVSNQRKEYPSNNEVDPSKWNTNSSEMKEDPFLNYEIPHSKTEPIKNTTNEYVHESTNPSEEIMENNPISTNVEGKKEADLSIKQVDPLEKKINFCKLKNKSIFDDLTNYFRKRLEENVLESFDPSMKLLNSLRVSATTSHQRKEDPSKNQVELWKRYINSSGNKEYPLKEKEVPLKKNEEENVYELFEPIEEILGNKTDLSTSSLDKNINSSQKKENHIQNKHISLSVQQQPSKMKIEENDCEFFHPLEEILDKETDSSANDLKNEGNYNIMNQLSSRQPRKCFYKKQNKFSRRFRTRRIRKKILHRGSRVFPEKEYIFIDEKSES